jgi:hypothetical protein
LGGLYGFNDEYFVFFIENINELWYHIGRNVQKPDIFAGDF